MYQITTDSKQKSKPFWNMKNITPPVTRSYKYPDPGSFDILKSEILAEFCGIALGDGHVPALKIGGKNTYTFSISLNSRDEKEYVLYVKDMLVKMFGRCYEYQSKTSNRVNLVINGKRFINFLYTMGLQGGNKVKNQVGVPGWIKENQNYEIACLRGLIDTDGCVFIMNNENSKYVKIEFSNRSINLLNDFCSMCNDIGIHPTKSGHNRRISSILDVRKFVDIVAPFKWKMIKERVKNDEELRRKYIDDYKPTRINISKTELEKLVREKTMKQVASELGFCYSSLFEKCKKFGIKNPGNGYWDKLSPTEKASKRRFNISKEELERMVWKKPTVDIAREIGVSDVAIAKRCKNLGITKPTRGYWTKHSSYQLDDRRVYNYIKSAGKDS